MVSSIKDILIFTAIALIIISTCIDIFRKIKIDKIDKKPCKCNNKEDTTIE